MPKISIIVPVYNVEKFLSKCIDSILSQTFKDFELILVNDGSADKSLEICKYYKSLDERICIIDKINGGLSSARNAGLEKAKGDYIGFIDSDDYVHPKMFELLYREIIKYNADISICDFEKVYNYMDNKNFSYESNHVLVKCLSNIEAIEKINTKNGVTFVIACNKLYKKNLFNKLRYKENVIHEDEFMAHRILYKAERIIYINEPLYFYVQREGSIMNSKSKISKIDYLLSLSDRIKFFYKKGLKKIQYENEEIYLYEIFRLYPEFAMDKNYKKKLLLRFDFLKLIRILRKNKNYSLKERIIWIVFILWPRLCISRINA